MKSSERKSGTNSRARTRRWLAILLAVAGWQTIVLLPLQAAAQKSITDDQINVAVERELAIEKGVSPNFVDVNTSQGIVTLSGSVDNLLAKDRAIKIAASVRGVRSVVDRMAVMPESRPDEDIRKDILMALLQDPATESYQIAASVKDAVVTLTGSVGSWPERQLAVRVAEGVKGVKAVDNEITINYLAKRTDQEIAADATAALQWDIWLNGESIDVTVNDGKVSLTGTVGSAIEKSRAVEDAWVNGVTGVDDSGLAVEPWARDMNRRKRRFVKKSDGEVQQAVLAAFHADPRVSGYSSNMIVSVEAGVAILTGSVGNLKAKTAAGHDAMDTVGVEWIENLLNVRPEKAITDADAEKALKAALLWDPLLGGSTVEGAVIQHFAYLSGTVEDNFEKSEAQDVAERIKGVIGVRNYITVQPEITVSYYNWPYAVSESYGPPPPKSDEQTEKDIEREFFWSPFVDRDDIKLTVNQGVATLTGTVGSWLAYGEAYRDAYKGGAKVVIVSGLKVKKGAWF